MKYLSVLLLVASQVAAQCPAPPPPASPPPPAPPGGSPGPITPGPATPAPRTSRPAGPATPVPGPAIPGPATGGRGPATARPAAPPLPAPAPATGGGGVALPPAAGLPSPATPATPRGVPLVLERGATSLDRLAPDWDFPVHVPERNQETTVASGALPRAAAFAAIAAGDPRPLLIVREADDGFGSALFAEAACDERVLMLTGWFHCVKLPHNVLTENHPFRNALTDGKVPAEGARVVLSRADGSGAVALDERTGQQDLLHALTAVLRGAYPRDAGRPMGQLLALLGEFDRVDAELVRLQTDLEKTLDRHGNRPSRLERLRAQIREATAERELLLQREAELRDLGRARAGD